MKPRCRNCTHFEWDTNPWWKRFTRGFCRTYRGYKMVTSSGRCENWKWKKGGVEWHEREADE